MLVKVLKLIRPKLQPQQRKYNQTGNRGLNILTGCWAYFVTLKRHKHEHELSYHIAAIHRRHGSGSTGLFSVAITLDNRGQLLFLRPSDRRSKSELIVHN